MYTYSNSVRVQFQASKKVLHIVSMLMKNIRETKVKIKFEKRKSKTYWGQAGNDRVGE